MLFWKTPEPINIMAEFDEKAATWDDDPIRVKRVESIAESLANILDLSAIDQAMEYGSGTGLLSFSLKDRLANVVLMDESRGMTEMAIKKGEVYQVDHFKPIQYDILKQPLPNLRFDLIYTLLTMHHVEETGTILAKFQQLLNQNGYLAIIDLDKEDGSFHEGKFHGHNGFDRFELENQLKHVGLQPTCYEVCYNIKKETESGFKNYPLFLLISQKKV